MRLWLLAERYAVCTAPHPLEPGPGAMAAVLRDADGCTWVGPETAAPQAATCRGGWRVLAVEGPLDFGLTGVLAALTAPLAEAEVPVFALSTWSTDFLLVPAERLEAARAALTAAGHVLTDAEDAG
ncbi:ACT domain-containing protein [Oceanithermus desulfurans]